MEKNLQMRQQYCFKTANVEFEMDKPATHNSFEHNFNEFNRRHKIPVLKTEYHRDFEGNRIPASFLEQIVNKKEIPDLINNDL